MARRRVKETLRQTVGVSSATDDEKFDERVREWEANVDKLREIKESMELFLDSWATFALAGSMMCEKMTTNFGSSSSSANKEAVGLFESISHDINNVIQPVLRNTVLKRCIQPIDSVLSLIAPIYDKMSARKEVLLDFDAYKTKLQNEFSTGNTTQMDKIQDKFQEASRKLALVQNEILHSMLEFETALPSMLGNEFTALVATMYFSSSSSAILMSQMLPFLPQAASTLCLLSLATATPVLSSPMCVEEIHKRQFDPVVPTLSRPETQGGAVGGYGLEAKENKSSDFFRDGSEAEATFSSDPTLSQASESTTSQKFGSLCGESSSSSVLAPPSASVSPVSMSQNGSEEKPCSANTPTNTHMLPNPSISAAGEGASHFDSPVTAQPAPLLPQQGNPSVIPPVRTVLLPTVLPTGPVLTAAQEEAARQQRVRAAAEKYQQLRLEKEKQKIEQAKRLAIEKLEKEKAAKSSIFSTISSSFSSWGGGGGGSAAAEGPFYALAELATSTVPPGVDPSRKEDFLDDEIFFSLFKVDKASFREQPKWKRDAKRKQLGLF